MLRGLLALGGSDSERVCGYKGEGLTEGLPDGTELREAVVEGRRECVVYLVSAEACPVITGLHARFVDEVDLDTILLD